MARCSKYEKLIPPDAAATPQRRPRPWPRHGVSGRRACRLHAGDPTVGCVLQSQAPPPSGAFTRRRARVIHHEFRGHPGPILRAVSRFRRHPDRPGVAAGCHRRAVGTGRHAAGAERLPRWRPGADIGTPDRADRPLPAPLASAGGGRAWDGAAQRRRRHHPVGDPSAARRRAGRGRLGGPASATARGAQARLGGPALPPGARTRVALPADDAGRGGGFARADPAARQAGGGSQAGRRQQGPGDRGVPAGAAVRRTHTGLRG